MARKMGVSMSMYEKVERGFAKPSRGFMEKLKEQFPDASIDEIFFSKYKDSNKE
jgi:transcriptional regulator with XRE-family HTH domain